MKFGTMTHNWPPTAERPLKFQIFENSRGRQPLSGKSQKSRYLRNALTDLYEIWYSGGGDFEVFRPAAPAGVGGIWHAAGTAALE